MKNIALCFDHVRDRTGSAGSGNTAAIATLLGAADDQIVWTATPPANPTAHRFAVRRHHRPEFATARTAVAGGYEFLVDCWEPGDRLYLFGAGRGGVAALALARLLGTVGVLRGTDLTGWTAAEFREYVLNTYAMPRTRRDAADWRRIGRLAADLAGRRDVAVEVAYLGLWDTVAVPGASAGWCGNVAAVRHAVAIDGGIGPFAVQRLEPAPTVEEVWFHGAHCDVVGAHNACAPLAGIALDWVLDGAVKAGATLGVPASQRIPAADVADALSGSAHPLPLRRLPADAAVHASVESYLRIHPSYWRRLPAHVRWADLEWAARAERLLASPPAPVVAPVLAGAPS